MDQMILIQLALLAVTGITAQWLAWRLQLPSILLLILAGLAAGPGMGWLQPDLLFGHLLLPLVSLAVAVILFEGGLSLRIADLRQVERAVVLICTIGVAVTLGGVALAAHWLLGLSLPYALLLGGMLTVTGPTVIIPLLHHVRPSQRVETLLRWEGIVVDPIGAMLAYVAFEYIQSSGDSSLFTYLILSLLDGLVLGSLGALLLITAKERFLVPDHLRNPLVLATVLGTFTLANHWVHESGLIAVTLMGFLIANQTRVDTRDLQRFKEDLTHLIIPALFLLLAARIPREALLGTGLPELIFLAVLILIIRPLAVFVSSVGTTLTGAERIYAAALAPRGIVAASVISIFAWQLEKQGFAEAGRLMPITFLVILGTVSIYGLMALPLARALGLADVHAQGILFLSAPPFARDLGLKLTEANIPVLFVDIVESHITAVVQAGMEGHVHDVFDEDAPWSLRGIGRMIALTENDELNRLAALEFTHEFGRREVYRLRPHCDMSNENLDGHQGRLVFHPRLCAEEMSARFGRGWTTQVMQLTEENPDLPETGIPLFRLDDQGVLTVSTLQRPLKFEVGDTAFLFVPPAET